MSTTSPSRVTTFDAHQLAPPLLQRRSRNGSTNGATTNETVQLHRHGSVRALRAGRVVAHGGLAARTHVGDEHVVSARTSTGEPRWVPAASVWSDAEPGTCDQPLAVGLATGTSWSQVLVSGLSDRLGWEAVQALEAGVDLPEANLAGAGTLASGTALVLDGRLRHDVPTVVVLGDEFVRWGAAATWDGAVRRAMFGVSEGDRDFDVELELVSLLLGREGLSVAGVDVGSEALRGAGLHRASVQLLVNRQTRTARAT